MFVGWISNRLRLTFVRGFACVCLVLWIATLNFEFVLLTLRVGGCLVLRLLGYLSWFIWWFGLTIGFVFDWRRLLNLFVDGCLCLFEFALGLWFGLRFAL